jgi:serine phosphatase RsbU (regulator of sigma subunit)
MDPIFANIKETEFVSPRAPSFLAKAALTSPAVRFRLSVSASTMIAVPPAWIRPPVVGVPPLPTAVIHPDRLFAVVASGLLDTAPETRFDDLVGLAREVAGGEQGFFAVVDAHRSFWKSAVGTGPGAGRETRVEDSVCQIMIATGAPLVVEDARHDVRTRGLGAVRELGIGAVVGHPVRDGAGQVIGGLCVSSAEARAWTAHAQHAVATLARAVSAEVQLRRDPPRSRAQIDALQTDRDEQAALARSLQDSLLPPLLPAIPGLAAAAAYLPAGHGVEVVGDFYDLFEADGHWCAVMGDVVGHGVEAAKLTALARYTIRTEAAHAGVRPSEVLGRLHEAMTAQHGHRKMLTVALATLRPGPGGVRGILCSAGHEPALIRRADGRIDIPPTRGRLLRVTPDVDLHDTPFVLHRGDALVLYTDGVTEARAGRGAELFGDDRLAAVLTGCHAGLGADAILDRLLHALAEHNRGYHSDDTAIMVILA